MENKTENTEEEKPEIKKEEQKWLRMSQRDLYKHLHTIGSGGFLGICVVVLQSFISTGKLDDVEISSVICFAAAIPLLAGCLVYYTLFGNNLPLNSNKLIFALFQVGSTFAMAGLTFALYHVSWIACVVFIMSVIITAYLVAVSMVNHKNFHHALLSIIKEFYQLIMTQFRQRLKHGKMR